MDMSDPVTALYALLPDPMGDPRASLDENRMSFVYAILAFKKAMATTKSADPDADILLGCVNDVVENKAKLDRFCSLLGRLALFRDPFEEGSPAKQRQLAYYRWIARGRKEEDYPFSSDGTLTRPLAENHVSHEFVPQVADTTQCAHCGRGSAPLKCGGCLVRIDNHIVFGTAYCSKECQVGHRKEHRTTCRDWQRLGRASSMYLETLVQVFKAANADTWRQVSEKDGVNVTVYGESNSQSVFVAADFEKAETGELATQTLMNGKCIRVVGDCRTLFELFFRRICKSAEVFSFLGKNMHRTVNHGFFTSKEASLPLQFLNTDVLHEVVRITMPSGVQVALDPTGAQYGWRDYLTPWDAFHQRRIHVVKGAWTVEPLTEDAWQQMAGGLCLHGKYKNAAGDLGTNPAPSVLSVMCVITERLVCGLLRRTKMRQQGNIVEDLKKEEFDNARAEIMASVGDSLREALREARKLPCRRVRRKGVSY